MTPQEKYCAQKKINMFAYSQYCTSCHKDMYEHEKVTDEVASCTIITACPWCRRSWLD